MFDAQLDSRHLDHTARWLRAHGLGFYTIGSAGHEANALVANALRPTDPPSCTTDRAASTWRGRPGTRARRRARCCSDCWRLLTSRSPADATRCSAMPVSPSYRRPRPSVPHLPRAMGVVLAIGRARRLGVEARWPADAIAVTSFGDASLNHSTAQGALNAASYTAHQGMAMPLLFV